MPLHVQVITPEKILIDENADEIVVPTTTGELAILPHHIPLVTQVAPGIVTIKNHGKDEDLAIDGGFIHVTDEAVTILADFAIHEREASAAKAQEAKKAAENAIKNKMSQDEIDTLQDEIRRSVLALRLTQKIKH